MEYESYNLPTMSEETATTAKKTTRTRRAIAKSDSSLPASAAPLGTFAALEEVF